MTTDSGPSRVRPAGSTAECGVVTYCLGDLFECWYQLSGGVVSGLARLWGISMGEPDEQENDGQPSTARNDDEEQAEQPGKRDRKSGWIFGTISLILDGISNAIPPG
jgi:hypothetical protein